MAPWRGLGPLAAVCGTTLGHLENGRGDWLLLGSFISHDADGHAGGLQTVNGVGEYSLDRRAGRNPRGKHSTPLLV
eukprot:9836175-Alexandrium_andersonii.AAC.1